MAELSKQCHFADWIIECAVDEHESPTMQCATEIEHLLTTGKPFTQMADSGLVRQLQNISKENNKDVKFEKK